MAKPERQRARAQAKIALLAGWLIATSRKRMNPSLNDALTFGVIWVTVFITLFFSQFREPSLTRSHSKARDRVLKRQTTKRIQYMRVCCSLCAKNRAGKQQGSIFPANGAHSAVDGV